jgi:hypothetical protein
MYRRMARDLLAPPDLDIHLQYESDARKAALAAHTPAGEAWRASVLSHWRSSSVP